MRWIKFYPDDWLNDENLSQCSLESQGLFARLLAVLNRGNPYGYLPRHLSDKEVARLIGVHPKTYRKCLDELLNRGVLKQDVMGIYNKRMVADQQKREEMSRRGKLGALSRYGKSYSISYNNSYSRSYSRSHGTNYHTSYSSSYSSCHNQNIEAEAEAEGIGLDTVTGVQHRSGSSSSVTDVHPPTPTPLRAQEEKLVGPSGLPDTDSGKHQPIPPAIVECVQQEWGANYWCPAMELWVRRQLYQLGATEAQLLYALREAANKGVRNRLYAAKILERLREEGITEPGEGNGNGRGGKFPVDIYGPDGETVVDRWDAETWAKRCKELDVPFWKETGRWRLRG